MMGDLLLDTFWRIGESPGDYLPDKSIWTLREFLSAYSTRIAMMQSDSQLTDLFGHFHPWLIHHFSIQSSTQSVYAIVDSFSADSRDSLGYFFDLFRLFYAEVPAETITSRRSTPYPAERDLFEVIKSIRMRPDLYLGYPHLAGINAYLHGYDRAGLDLGLSKTPADIFFDGFKEWIVYKKFPGGRPRLWHKLIQFWSLHDCGASGSSAFGLFFELLDAYAREAGKPGIFETGQ